MSGPAVPERVRRVGPLATSGGLVTFVREQLGKLIRSPVVLGQLTELLRALVLRDGADAFLHIFPTQMQRVSVAPDPQSDVHVRVFGIAVSHGNPLQRSVQVPFHPAQNVAGESEQIDAVAKLRRDDQLPQALVSCGLPFGELSCNFNSLPGGVETRWSVVTLRPSPFALDVPTVGAPMAGSRVAGVDDPDRATLEMRTR
jgi:hypothetical protein